MAAVALAQAWTAPSTSEFASCAEDRADHSGLGPAGRAWLGGWGAVEYRAEGAV